MPDKSKTTKGGGAKTGGGEKNMLVNGKANVLVPKGATVESVLKELMAAWTQGQDFEWRVGDRYNVLVVLLARERGVHAQQLLTPIVRDIGQTTLSRYGRVAKAFPEEVAKKYGMSKLELLLHYEQLAHEKPVEGDPGTVAIAVPQKDGSLGKKPFADCSVRDLRDAITHLHQPGRSTGPSHPPAPPPNDPPNTTDEKHALEVLRSGIEAAQGTHAAIQIRTRKGPRGLLLDLVGIPVSDVTHVLSTIVDKQLADALKEAGKKAPKVPGLQPAKPGKKR